MMLSVTVKRNQSSAPVLAAWNLGLEKAKPAQHVKAICREENLIVLMRVGVNIGHRGKMSVGSAEKMASRPAKMLFMRVLADRVRRVAFQTGVFWKSTILTRLKRLDRQTCITAHSGALSFGRKKSQAETCKFYAQTATESKRTNSLGRDIACKRVEDAYRQPDLFVPKPQPIAQDEMDI
jgi:hypothetical protein